jgi:hypothetical protein
MSGKSGTKIYFGVKPGEAFVVLSEPEKVDLGKP